MAPSKCEKDKLSLASNIKSIVAEQQFIKSDAWKDTTYDEVEVRLELMQATWSSISKESQEILITIRDKPDEVEVIEEQVAQAREIYIEVYGALKRVIRKCNEKSALGTTQTASDVIQGKPLNRGVKVKPIEPPEFNGMPETWTSYRDVFESIIHTNDSLDAIQKFHYLRQSMKLPSGLANILDSFTFTADNYEAAWTAVKKRYDDKRKIISAHLNAMFSAKRMINSSAIELRKLIDVFSSNLSALRQQDHPLDSDKLANALCVHMAVHRLDDETLREWRKFHKEDTATWCQLLDFLEALQRSLDDKQLAKKFIAKPTEQKQRSSRQATSHATSNESSSIQRSCILCAESHALWHCARYLQMSVADRFKFVQEKMLCLNCLSKGHQHRSCTSNYRCKQCKKAHHSSLHFEYQRSSSTADSLSTSRSQKVTATPENISSENVCPPDFRPMKMTKKSQENGSLPSNAPTTLTTMVTRTSGKVMPTVLLQVADATGLYRICRALLDTGSNSNFIRTQLAKALGLTLVKCNTTLFGISGLSTPTTSKTNATIRSIYDDNYHMKLEFTVLDDITSEVPSHTIDIARFNFQHEYPLADPTFNEAMPVDMLLDSDVFYDCLMNQRIIIPDGPKLTETRFGWVVGGVIPSTSSHATVSTSLLASYSIRYQKAIADIDAKLEKFIECEDIPSSKPALTAEERYCEDLFVQTTTRHEVNGKFIVRMPRKENAIPLGENIHNAYKMFRMQEARRKKDPIYNNLYVEYMEDYIKSGDMTEIDVQNKSPCHLLPHHGVVKMSSSSTKLRPVFNASSITETGISLNDTLCVGPTVQSGTIDILMRFRETKYVFLADIARMYRQVLIEPSQRSLLQVLWSSKFDEPVKRYQLNTVTFGTSSAPYLATRVIKQIALDHQEQFPEASAIMINSIYVDDLLSGHNNRAKAQRLLLQIRYMLSTAGMKLCKFIANDPAILQQLPDSEIQPIDDEKTTIKALGIKFDARADEFSYQLKLMDTNVIITRSTVLSELFGIFDPIGWIGPVILQAKVFMRTLCLQKLKWDEELSQDDQLYWNHFRSTLPTVNNIKIPRHCVIENHKSVEVHGFCDASVNGYGCIIYALSFDSNGAQKVSILIAKSKVAPSRQKTLARLELCAATLLAKVIEKTLATLSVNINHVSLWSDSTIVLSWITIHPLKLSTFVGNRVSVITELTHQHTWRHIKGIDNPADVISRGLSPEEIQHSSLWWNGPSFFQQPKSLWPESRITINADDPEVKAELKKSLVARKSNDLVPYIEARYSDVTKLFRIFILVRRFINNISRRQRTQVTRSPLEAFTTDEFEFAEMEIIRILQKHFYASEYQQLMPCDNKQQLISEEGQRTEGTADQCQQTRQKFAVAKTSSLIALSPFLDENGLIRVGGRLSNSPKLTYNQKHPIILPQCHFTTILLRRIHIIHLHAGPTAMLSIVRDKYWPIRARNVIKHIVNRCIICFRVNPKYTQQIMSDLPRARVTASPPFTSTAIDYAGYYIIKSSQNRNAPSVKCYVCLFKCMCTGAIHLELVSDLTSHKCIQAIERFVSRRGKSYEFYTDNGTCFEGSDNELKQIVQNMKGEIAEYCTSQAIRWNFTTPRAPHAGGIYESGIKSMKHHLKRVFNHNFTFEQFTTVLCKIEAILNSRPLTPISNDPHDLECLTPAHFLIGRPLTSMPQRNYMFLPTNRLEHWQLVQQKTQEFWAQWSREYLQTLQKRPIKFREEKQFHVGDMVLLIDKNLPSLKWLMGRIIQMFPAKGSTTVRNVKVLTQHGPKERDVRYLCFLPLEKISNDQQSKTF